MIANRPKQRVSLKEKMKPDYYINNIHYYIGVAMSTNDKGETLDNLNSANGVVPDTTYKYVLEPLSPDGTSFDNLPGVIRDTDFITPIREKNIGEYIELPNEFTVKVDDPNITIVKNKEVGDIIRPFIEQAVINKINEDKETGVPSKPVDIEKVVSETLENWIDTRAENALHLVKSIINENDLDNKRLTLFNYWWATEEAYIHLYTTNGAIFFDVISPLEGYPIDNGYEFTDDKEGFLIRRKLTIDRIEEYYGDELTAKDREYLYNLLENNVDGRFVTTADVYEDIYGRKVMSPNGGTFNRSDKILFSNGRDVDEYVLFYKTEVERKILFYFNELGEVQQRVIEDDEDFTFDENLGHIKVEKEWITETWKQVLLGEEYAGIYLKPKPEVVQIYDEKGHNKLPIFGKNGLINGVYKNPVPKRIVPNLALHKLITLQIERQIAKYKGSIELIPQSMLGDNAGTVKANMFYKLADNTIIYDDTKVDFNTVAQGYRLVGNDAQSNFIKMLIDYRDVIKAEAWDMANMNDARYGTAPASSTVTNNQQNIFNAKLGSVLSITTFNSILVRLYTGILAYAEYVYPDGTKGSVFEKDGTIKYFNINSGELTANKYGIYMTNSVIDFNKLKEYKEFAFAAGQHGEFELAESAIKGDSVSSIRKHVNEYLKMKREYEKQLEQQKLQLQKQAQELAAKDKEADRQLELDKITLQEKLQEEREVKVASVKNNKNK